MKTIPAKHKLNWEAQYRLIEGLVNVVVNDEPLQPAIRNYIPWWVPKHSDTELYHYAWEVETTSGDMVLLTINVSSEKTHIYVHRHVEAQWWRDDEELYFYCDYVYAHRAEEGSPHYDMVHRAMTHLVAELVSHLRMDMEMEW